MVYSYLELCCLDSPNTSLPPISFSNHRFESSCRRKDKILLLPFPSVSANHINIVTIHIFDWTIAIEVLLSM